MASFPTIPAPIAPVRPLSSGSLPVTMADGTSATIDSLGNLTSSTGTSLGSVPGTPTLPTLPSLGSLASGLTSAAGTVANATSRLVFGFSLEDGIFIVLGLLLIAAGIFSFKSTAPVVESFTGGVRDAVRHGAEASA